MREHMVAQPHTLGDQTRERARPNDSSWQHELPVLSVGEVVLREVRTADAPALAALFAESHLTRYISPPPATVEGFELFIVASQRARANGEGACFAVTLRDHATPIGMFQIRSTVPADGHATRFGAGASTAEWGFALGIPFWGTGVFPVCAALVLGFVFEHMGVHRLEARCAIRNGRGGRALVKLGAVPEGVLRQSVLCGDQHLDQVLYAVVADDWKACRDRCRAVATVNVH